MDEARRRALEYEVIVSQRDGRVHARLPRLDLRADGANVEETYDSLMQVTSALLARFEDEGRLEELPVPAPITQTRRTGFATSLAILVGIVMGFALSAATIYWSAIVGTLDAFGDPRRAGKIVLEYVHQLVEVAATTSPERKAEIHKDLRAIVREVHPFIDDLRPWFSDEPAAAPTLRVRPRMESGPPGLAPRSEEP